MAAASIATAAEADPPAAGRGLAAGRFLLEAFVFCAPFTTWLAASTWLRLPVIFILLGPVAFAPLMLQGFVFRPLRFLADREDLLLHAFVCVAAVSYALGFGSGRSLKHLLAIAFTFTFYLALFKWMSRASGLSARGLAGVIAWSASACCAIIILEFALLNLLDFRIRPFFITVPETSNMEFFIRGPFKSIAGPAEEPGTMAVFMNIFCPIGLWHFHQGARRTAFNLLLAGYVLSMLFLTSVAGLVNAGVIAAVVALWRVKPLLWFARKATVPLLAVLAALAATIGEKLALIVTSIPQDILFKLTLSQESASAAVRSKTWKQSLADWEASPLFGNGPGYGVETLTSGYHSVFLTVLADLGLVGLALLLAFFASIVWKLAALPRDTISFFAIPLLGTLVHFIIIGDYYHAPFWICVGLVQRLYAESRPRAEVSAT